MRGGQYESAGRQDTIFLGGIKLRSVELFAGAGGLAMGVSRAGFKHDAVIEYDHDTCVTIRANQTYGVRPLCEWPLIESDVRLIDYGTLEPGLDLLAGGPPCQPFSLGGKHRGPLDKRDMFPEAVRAVRELMPKAFIFENVKGLLRQSFTSYFEYIILQLTYPELVRNAEEAWTDHLSRLERHHTGGVMHGMKYRVVFRLVNAADHGVPQCRERVIIVGLRDDLNIDWSFPAGTHSQDALLWRQWVSEDYWDRHRVSKAARPHPAKHAARIERIKSDGLLALQEPWLTVRDAIGDLPDPRTPEAAVVANHRFMAGARAYPGHTGSALDEPAKTLKAGDHGVPGGENMLANHDQTVRYFTVREASRIQTFPDDYRFTVSWTESMRQLGNAVPVRLGEVIARSVRRRLENLG
jgi:DNA (cytosine-5)-methyltransferase 1